MESNASMASSANADTISMLSDVGSEVSTMTVPDRHGFLVQIEDIERGREVRHGPPAETILRREKKWLKMMDKNEWDKYMTRNHRKVRERCRKGIPQSVRPKAWSLLCGGQKLMETYEGQYEDYLKAPGDQKCLDDIKKDIHRQFPTHEMFSSVDKPGQIELYNILKAYTIIRKDIGYCQGQAPVAAFLLMHMPAEQAFWCLISISDTYLKGYYEKEMEMVRRDGLILQGLLKKICPPVYRHLKKCNVEPMYYCTEWFLCAFTRTLPWDTLLRVWDVFLFEGIKVLFKTALVILIGCLGTAQSRKNCPGLCETLEKIRSPPPGILSEENMIYNINRLDISERDFQLEHQKQEKRLRMEKLANSKNADKRSNSNGTTV